MFEQCAILEVIKPFSFKLAKGRTVKGKIGQWFWVTSPTYKNQEYCLIAREGQGSTNTGWLVDNSDIKQFFKLVD